MVPAVSTFMIESSVWRSVFQKLIYNETTTGSPEGIMRILGFVHLYTASGIHIYAFLSFMEKIAEITGLPKWFLRTLSYFIVLLMWDLQQFRIAFARPLITFFIRKLAQEKGMKWRVFYPLVITFALDLILNIDSGRLHYYLAVSGGLLAAELFESGMMNHVSMAFGSWAFTAVVDLCQYHEIAWMTPLYSLITIPVISIILYPLSVIGILFSPHSLSWIEFAWQEFIDFVLLLPAQGLTFSVISTRTLMLSLAMSVGLMVYLYFVKVRRLQFYGLVSLVILAILVRVSSPQLLNDSRLVQLDVKQGDGLLIEKHGRVEMIDVGSAKAMKPSDWIHEFSRYGVSEVDAILFTHLDEDHIGAVKVFSNLLPVHCIQTHENHWKSEKGRKLVSYLLEHAADTELSNQSCMQIPKTAWFASSDHRGNGNELMAGSVIEVSPSRAYVALGDADVSQEEKFANVFQQELSSYPHKFWKVSHHGSRFSSGEAFLKVLQPDEVWISVGKHNHYHHPHPSVMARLQELGIPYQRTDEVGDIVVSME